MGADLSVGPLGSSKIVPHFPNFYLGTAPCNRARLPQPGRLGPCAPPCGTPTWAQSPAPGGISQVFLQVRLTHSTSIPNQFLPHAFHQSNERPGALQLPHPTSPACLAPGQAANAHNVLPKGTPDSPLLTIPSVGSKPAPPAGLLPNGATGSSEDTADQVTQFVLSLPGPRGLENVIHTLLAIFEAWASLSPPLTLAHSASATLASFLLCKHTRLGPALESCCFLGLKSPG